MEWWEILIAIVVSIIVLWMLGLSIAIGWIAIMARTEINSVRKHMRGQPGDRHSVAEEIRRRGM